MSKTKDRLCTSRRNKTAKHIERIAGHLIEGTNQGITSIISEETLAQLHTIENTHEVIQNKDLAILLEKDKLPSIKSTVSDPLFQGTLFFVQITFNTPSGSFSINNADMLTALNYSKVAINPISDYASQYGPNSLSVSNNIIQYSVTLSGKTYTDSNLKSWVNDIVSTNRLSTNSSCIVILNPWTEGIVNTNEDPRRGVGGYHGKVSTPFCFCNVFGQNLTVDDRQNAYAQILSHEIAEMTVDPLANIVNPEVCDACAPNCNNLWNNFFDNGNQFIDGSQSLPPSFAYKFFVNALVKPASYNPATECAIPGSNTHDVCVYIPPKVFSAVYAQGDPGNGIGGYDLKSAADRAFAFDYDGSGRLDHIAYVQAWYRYHVDSKEG